MRIPFSFIASSIAVTCLAFAVACGGDSGPTSGSGSSGGGTGSGGAGATGSGSGSSTGTTGATGTGATGSTTGTTTGTSGIGSLFGDGGALSCSACENAPACCTALVAIAGEDAGTCAALSMSACLAASATDQQYIALECSLIVAEGSGFSSSCK